MKVSYILNAVKISMDTNFSIYYTLLIPATWISD